MLKKEELDRIKESIKDAEENTSGEIRVYVARHCKGNPLETASKKFHQLKMDNTRLRNGVLIYLSIADHKAAIFADDGINQLVENDNFWQSTLDLMLIYFKENEIEKGISKGVEKVGELLKEFFPVTDEVKNELDNEVIIED